MNTESPQLDAFYRPAPEESYAVPEIKTTTDYAKLIPDTRNAAKRNSVVDNGGVFRGIPREDLARALQESSSFRQFMINTFTLGQVLEWSNKKEESHK